VGKYLIILFFLLTSSLIFSQQTKNDSIAVKKSDSLSTDLKTRGIVVEEVTYQKQINPLAPSKAAFLSALLPGMGQIYNKRYWEQLVLAFTIIQLITQTTIHLEMLLKEEKQVLKTISFIHKTVE
jgi:hypothetical protein